LVPAGLPFLWQDRFFARFGTGTGHADFSTLNTHIDAIATQSVGVTPDASSQHAHGRDALLPPADLHGAYVNNRPLPTEGMPDAHKVMTSPLRLCSISIISILSLKRLSKVYSDFCPAAMRAALPE
jgi:hypothetical protein